MQSKLHNHNFINLRFIACFADWFSLPLRIYIRIIHYCIWLRTNTCFGNRFPYIVHKIFKFEIKIITFYFIFSLIKIFCDILIQYSTSWLYFPLMMFFTILSWFYLCIHIFYFTKFNFTFNQNIFIVIYLYRLFICKFQSISFCRKYVESKHNFNWRQRHYFSSSVWSLTARIH